MKQPNPYVTVDAAGVWVHVPQADGDGTKAFNVSPDSVHVLIAELTEKAELLKTPETQKKLASKLLDLGIEWLHGRRSKKK